MKRSSCSAAERCLIANRVNASVILDLRTYDSSRMLTFFVRVGVAATPSESHRLSAELAIDDPGLVLQPTHYPVGSLRFLIKVLVAR